MTQQHWATPSRASLCDFTGTIWSPKYKFVGSQQGTMKTNFLGLLIKNTETIILEFLNDNGQLKQKAYKEETKSFEEEDNNEVEK